MKVESAWAKWRKYATAQQLKHENKARSAAARGEHLLSISFRTLKVRDDFYGAVYNAMLQQQQIWHLHLLHQNVPRRDVASWMPFCGWHPRDDCMKWQRGPFIFTEVCCGRMWRSASISKQPRQRKLCQHGACTGYVQSGQSGLTGLLNGLQSAQRYRPLSPAGKIERSPRHLYPGRLKLRTATDSKLCLQSTEVSRHTFVVSPLPATSKKPLSWTSNVQRIYDRGASNKVVLVQRRKQQRVCYPCCLDGEGPYSRCRGHMLRCKPA